MATVSDLHSDPIAKKLNGKKVEVTKQTSKEQRAAKKAAQYTERQIRQLAGILAITIILPVFALMGISLPHLASESEKILHCGTVVSWLTAFTFDVSQLAAEVILVAASTLALTNSKKVPYFGIITALWTVIGSCSFVSWALNTLAFNREAGDLLSHVTAFSGGFLIPALILLLLYISTTLAKRWWKG